ncbi:MAG TPA: EsaB/YukD family protein, partial [Acidimicrobiales bacterium]|nr:EsaB/YukD family protein [Acidimicrobiales bacterium]
MSNEVLVTVVGAARRGDVCLDDTVPISALLADLRRHYGGPVSSAELVLADDTGAVLDPSNSLREAGVTHGTRLMLRAREAVPTTPAVSAAPAAPVAPVAPAAPAAPAESPAPVVPVAKT